MDVPDQGQKATIVFDCFALVSMLKQMPRPAVLLIDALHKAYADAFHDLADVLFLGFDQQMNVVAHQAAGIQLKTANRLASF